MCSESNVPLLREKANLAELYQCRGSAHFEMGEFQQAIADFDYVLTLYDAKDIGDEKRICETFVTLSEKLKKILTDKHPALHHFMRADSYSLLFYLFMERGAAHLRVKNFQLALSDLANAFNLRMALYQQYKDAPEPLVEEDIGFYMRLGAASELIEIHILRAEIYAENKEFFLAAQEYQSIIDSFRRDLNSFQVRSFYVKKNEFFGDHWVTLGNYNNAYEHYKHAYNIACNITKPSQDLSDKYARSCAVYIMMNGINAISPQEVKLVLDLYNRVISAPSKSSNSSNSSQNASSSDLTCCIEAMVRFGLSNYPLLEKSIQKNQPIPESVQLELLGDQYNQKYKKTEVMIVFAHYNEKEETQDVSIPFLYDAIECYEKSYAEYSRAYVIPGNFSVYNGARENLREKLIDAHREAMVQHMTPRDIKSAAPLGAYREVAAQYMMRRNIKLSAPHALKHYREIQKFSAHYQNKKLAVICSAYASQWHDLAAKETSDKAKKYLKKSLEFYTMAIQLNPNEASHYDGRALIYYKLAELCSLSNMNHDEKMQFYSLAFFDCIQVLKRNQKLSHDYVFTKMLPTLSANDLITIVSPFFIGKRRLLLKQCLDEKHFLGVFIKNRGITEKYQITQAINSYLNANVPLKLSDRFFKSEPEYQNQFFKSDKEFQEYKKEEKKKRWNEEQSNIRITLFSEKIDMEYNKNENKTFGVAGLDDSEPEEKTYWYDEMYRL